MGYASLLRWRLDYTQDYDDADAAGMYFASITYTNTNAFSENLFRRALKHRPMKRIATIRLFDEFAALLRMLTREAKLEVRGVI